MKYLKRLIVTMLAILLFVAIIKNISLGNFQAVASPDNLTVPTQGTWKIANYKLYNNKESDEEALKQMLGKNAVFSRGFASVAGINCEAPKYSVKNVNTEQYMAFTRNVFIETGITKAKSEVISVTSGDKHFFDMFLVDANNLAILSTGGILFLTKVSEDALIVNVTETNNSAVSNRKDSVGRELRTSGVLLGVKTTISPNSKTDIPTYKYKTVWIGKEEGNMLPAKEADNLLVPRSTGFWKVDVSRIQEKGYTNDKIISYPLENDSRRSFSNRGVAENYLSGIQNITFVGNDYISLEYGMSQDMKSPLLNKLKIVPLSTPEQAKIKVGEIFGDKAKDVLTNSAKIFSNSNNSIADTKNYVSEVDNIGMFRKNGHWILKGRLDYEGVDSRGSFKDFYISLIPEKKLVTYDNLSISWSYVKSVVPEALDIFESPNSDFAIIVTKNCLCVYEINNNLLAQIPSAKYKMDENETIIMSEWATGDYTWKWDKTMESIGKLIN